MIKDVIYSKQFKGKPLEKIYGADFTIGDEDFNFRLVAHEQFNSRNNPNTKHDSQGEGFDGVTMYFFRFNGQPNGKEETYTTHALIKKIGDKGIIQSEPSDLEKFLIVNGFKLE
jgi:hypothetical protein